MNGTCRVEYCPVNTSEEDCNTTTSASGANTTLTGLQSFTWYRLTRNCSSCAGTISGQPLLASTAPLSPAEYGIKLEYDLPNETLKLSKSWYNLTVPDEICFKPVETLDPADYCLRNNDQCVSVGSTLHNVVPLKSGLVGVVSYGRQTCSVPSFVRFKEDAMPTSSASHSFILTVTGATVGGTVVILVLVFGVMMTARPCRKKKDAKHETRSSYRSVDHHLVDGVEQNSGRIVDEDGLIYVAVSSEERPSTQQTSPIRTEEETIYSAVRTEGNGIQVDEDGLVYFSVSHPLQPDSSESQEHIQPEETTIYSSYDYTNSQVIEAEAREDASAMPLYATSSKQKQF
ncbi:uncharacterized protein [Diadema antillarum]|uniref:uncharacterized protein n=1 Tax=Diadema antillarum TaxID=105358 RepID=UPI003A864753